jgi:hypothetical protein
MRGGGEGIHGGGVFTAGGGGYSAAGGSGKYNLGVVVMSAEGI